MLKLSGALLSKEVLSLRTGTPVASVQAPIINPNNLKVEGFYVADSVSKQPFILLYQDIRDIVPQGYVIDDHDVLAEPSELVRLKSILELNFQLGGKPVETISKDKVGKVDDFATEITTMYVQKLYVSQNIMKSFTGGSLSVDRTQIHEITNRRIIIGDLLKGAPVHAAAAA
jgi:sporulation protein YlmC with PRC-barrel domain